MSWKVRTSIIGVVIIFCFFIPQMLFAAVDSEESGVSPVIDVSFEKINLNTASLDALCALKRIGPKYAQRIIDYRENVGYFKIPEDIMRVKGIGQKTFQINKDIIEVTIEVDTE